MLSPRVRTVLSTATNIVLTLLCAAAVALMFVAWPAKFGGDASYVFVSGNSMYPTYRTEDLIVAKQRRSYEVGDVIVYRVPDGIAEGRLIVHRVIGGDGRTGYTTRGDNNASADPFHPTDSDVLGSVWAHSDQGRHLRMLLRLFVTPWVWALMGTAVAFFIAWRAFDPEDEGHERTLSPLA